MTMTPDLVLFAIQSALKLGEASKKYQIDSVHAKELTLPYLNFDQNLDSESILEIYVDDDDVYEGIIATSSQLVKDLANRLRDPAQDDLDEAEKRTLVYAYWKKNEQASGIPNDDLNGDLNNIPVNSFDKNVLISSSAFHAFSTIKQYTDKQGETIFRRLGGTFLEIGVDYFAHAPNGFNVDSREAVALRALFIGLDHVKFSESRWKEQIGEFPRKLSIALLDTVTKNSDVFSGDKHSQDLIEKTASALSLSVEQHFKDIDAATDNVLAQRQHIMSWGEVIFRSILGSAGKMVSENPQTYLDLDDPAKTTLFKDLSSVLLNITLGTEAGKLGKAFSKQSLDELVKTTLSVIAKHPDLTGQDDQGVMTLISQVANGLSSLDSVVQRDVLPEAVRLIIEKSGENLELLWPDAGEREEKQVLLLATKELFSNLSATPADSTWKLAFSKDDVLGMLDTALREVANNPAWVVDSAYNRNAYLGDAIKAMVEVVNGLKDERITSKIGSEMIRSGLRAAALRLEFLDDLPNGKTVIGSVFDAIVGSVSKTDKSSKAAWRLARGDVLQGLLDLSLEKLQDEEITENQITNLRLSMQQQIEDINQGKPWNLEQFAKSLETALSA